MKLQHDQCDHMQDASDVNVHSCAQQARDAAQLTQQAGSMPGAASLSEQLWDWLNCVFDPIQDLEREKLATQTEFRKCSESLSEKLGEERWERYLQKRLAGALTPKIKCSKRCFTKA